jgi:transcriptional regulator with XRE-family HTH domain
VARGTGQPKTGAAALKEAVHVGYVRAGYTSLMQLSIASGVSYDTFMNWFGGKTRPRGAELQRVAKTIDVPYADLEAAYEGREPEPPALVDAVAELTAVVRELVVEIREDRERGQDAAAAILRAAGALRPNNGGAPASRERPVPDGSRG